MRRVPYLLATALAIALWIPRISGSQSLPAAPPDSGFRLRVGGPIEVGREEHEGGVVVIRGTALVHGKVGFLLVVDGRAEIVGGEVGELVVVRGHALLGEGAVVTGDVHLLDSDIDAGADARIDGRIERGVGRRFAGEAVAVIALLSLGMLLAIVGVGALAALAVPTPLRATGALIGAEPGRVIGAAALVWLAFPLVAVLLIPTVVGLPLGLGYLFLGLPLLGLVGTIVAGSWLGEWMIRRLRLARTVHPAAAAMLGTATILVVGRIPVLGLASFAVTVAGSGAILLALVRAIRSGSGSPVAAS